MSKALKLYLIATLSITIRLLNHIFPLIESAFHVSVELHINQSYKSKLYPYLSNVHSCQSSKYVAD